MDDSNPLPNDLAECQRLLLAAFKQAVELERNAAVVEKRAERRLARAQEEADELRRVLDETASWFEELGPEHAARLEELAWYKRRVHGRRRERVDAPRADREGHAVSALCRGRCGHGRHRARGRVALVR